MTTVTEKAARWDRLCRMLESPRLRDVATWHLANMRRAALMLLAHREELPSALTRELDAYRTVLDALYLEMHDGFSDLEGILNAIPAYAVMSVAGSITGLDEDREHLRRLGGE